MSDIDAARFEIDGVSSYKSGVLLVGRCTRGQIRIGDVFKVATKRIVVKGEGHNFSVSKETLGSVSLKVEEIQYFRKFVELLSTQHSGAIYVSGDGIERIAAGCEIDA
ncbi:MAG TPA: hypothetical protein VGM81_16490 [Burkholderiaceae bacterium]|jgi:hypothetical protein